MPTPIVHQLARQLGADQQDTSHVLDELVQDIRQQVAADGQFVAPGLGVFRSFAGRIVFEPDQALAFAVNHRYAGLEPLMVSAAEMAPTTTPAETEPEEQPAEAKDLYPTEAPPFAIHPADEEAPAGAEEPAPAEPEESSDRSRRGDGQDVPLTAAIAAPLGAEPPVSEFDEETEPTPENPAYQEDEIQQVPPERSDLEDPDYVEDLPGAMGPPPEVSVHDEFEAAADEEPFDGLPPAPDEVDERRYADFTQEIDDSAPESPPAVPGPFFPWQDEAGTPAYDGFTEVPFEEEPADVEEPGDPFAEPEEPDTANAYPDFEEEHVEESAASEPLEEAAAFESDFVTEQESPWMQPEPDNANAFTEDEIEREIATWPEAESAFRPEPIEEDYSDYAPPDPPTPIAPPPAEEIYEPLPHERKREPVAADERNGSNRVWLFVGLVLVILLGGLAYALLRPDGAPTGPSVVETEPEEEVSPLDTTVVAAVPETTQPEAVDESDAPAPEQEATEEPAAPAPSEPVGGINVSEGGLTLVVASVTSRDDALRVAQRFRDAGYTAAVFHGEYGGVTRYRVGVGQYMDENAAEAERENLPEIFPRDAWLMAIQSDMDIVE